MIITGTRVRGGRYYGGTASAVTTDEYFNLVSLLLPGNGTNGAQNNTFLDSSTNNFTVTRNGNTTQGTFSPFSFGGGTEQANGYYSGYFDGTGDYLNQSTNRFLDGSTWTVEGWVYTADTAATIAAQYVSSGGQFSSRTILGISSGLIYIFQAGSSVSGTTNISNNQWYHIAYVRNGSTVKAYVNGRLEATFSGFINPSLTTTTFFYDGFNSGQEFLGYFSNLRVTTTEVYASNFTPPTSPLTAITGTALLTCQSSQFIDNSPNAFAITVNGNPQPTVVNPFGMTDWSGYFDGTGDYLNLTQSAFAVGTGNFTLEAWVFLTSAPGTEAGVISSFNTATGQGFYLAVNSSRQPFFAIGNGGVVNPTVTGAAIPLNTWVHLAGVRSSGTISLYVNGSSVGTPTSATASIDRTLLGIGLAYPNSPQLYITGCISNARITSNAVYTSNFTVPTAPLTAISGTALLTCQSSTFIDNSTNAFTITVNGNAYTGTLNNPFGSIVNYTTPPVQAWSNYFGGGSSTERRLSTTQTAIGTGNFTVAFWVYLVGTTGNDQQFFDTGTGGFVISVNTSTQLQIQNRAAGTTTISPSSATAIPLNTWVHVAVVRFGTGASQVTMYVNGSPVGTGTMSSNFTSTTISIGGRFAVDAGVWYTTFGYISNVLYDNSALSITVPTTPYTNQSGTKLLTCQSNRFVDNSINQLAITRAGDTSVQPFSPFNPDAVYSTTSVGGSGYFDGNGDYLDAGPQTAFAFGTGSWTVEAWVYVTSLSSEILLFDTRSSVSTAGVGCRIATDGTLSYSGSTNNTLTSTAIKTNEWNHIAWSYNGTTLSGYINGAIGGTATPSFNISQNNGIVGRVGFTAAAYMSGYIASLRVVKGTAVYTTGFVPPPAPLTAIANTSLLLNYTNAGIPDAAAKNALETVGSAQISTAQSKFGGSSMSFDGSGDTLLLPPSINNLFITASNFTLEFWYRFASTPGASQYVYSVRQDGDNYLFIYATSSGWVFDTFSSGGQGPKITSSSLSHDNTTFHHFALVYNSGTYTMYVDGSSVGSQANSSVLTALNGYAVSLPYYIGSRANIDSYFNGYLDDFRITKGYARYTTNFTPPTTAFPTQ